MKKLLLFQIFLILVLLPLACNKDKDVQPGKVDQQYNGNAKTTIRYYEFNVSTGHDDFIEEKQYTYNVLVFIKQPLAVGSVTESNPFDMQIYPDRTGNPDEEGHLDFSSCLIINDVTLGQVILQFWNYTLNGTQINGTLTDNHIAESSAANIIWAWDDVAGMKMVMPFFLANGCLITGTVGNTINLTISGESTDSYRKFNCQISAVPQ